VKLKPSVTPAPAVSQKQYFIPPKTQVGIQKHFDRLLKHGILKKKKKKIYIYIYMGSSNPVSHPGTHPYYQSRNWGLRTSDQFRTSGQ
jgi:hypothetical protein